MATTYKILTPFAELPDEKKTIEVTETVVKTTEVTIANLKSKKVMLENQIAKLQAEADGIDEKINSIATNLDLKLSTEENIKLIN